MVMLLMDKWTIAEEVQEGGRLASPLTAADPPSRDSFGRGVRPVERGVAEVRGDLPSLQCCLETRAVIRLVSSREARTVGLLDIDPIRRHDLELVDDFFSRMAH